MELALMIELCHLPQCLAGRQAEVGLAVGSLGAKDGQGPAVQGYSSEVSATGW